MNLPWFACIDGSAGREVDYGPQCWWYFQESLVHVVSSSVCRFVVKVHLFDLSVIWMFTDYILSLTWLKRQNVNSGAEGWVQISHQATSFSFIPFVAPVRPARISSGVRQQMTPPSLVFYKRLFSLSGEREQAAPAVPARRLYCRCVVNYSRQHTRTVLGGAGVRRGGTMGEEGEGVKE